MAGCRCGWTRLARVVVLAGSLGPLAGVQAQAPFPVPVPASVVIVPLLALWLPLFVLAPRGDEARLRTLESRHDWPALAALAGQRLAAQPGDARWLFLRGHALQMSQGCAAATPDLAASFDAAPSQAGAESTEPAFAAGLGLALCQLLGRQWADAEATMQRLAEMTPERWEVDYQLAWLLLRRGDAAAAGGALDRLHARRPALAGWLLRHPPRMADAALPEDLPRGRTALLLGSRTLVLPAGGWAVQREMPLGVHGGGVRGPTGTEVVVRLQRYAAWTEAAAGSPVGMQLAANEHEATGIVQWHVDARCAAPDALLVERFGRRVDLPECLLVHVRESIPEGFVALPPVHDGSAAAGPGYEIEYRRYGLGWAVQARWWLPAELMPGHLAAAVWARMMAEALRPLAEGRSAGPLPPLPR